MNRQGNGVGLLRVAAALGDIGQGHIPDNRFRAPHQTHLGLAGVAKLIFHIVAEDVVGNRIAFHLMSGEGDGELAAGHFRAAPAVVRQTGILGHHFVEGHGQIGHGFAKIGPNGLFGIVGRVKLCFDVIIQFQDITS